MIEVSRTDSGVTVIGHAGYAETGKDIVCAAVSTILQTFIESIGKLTDDKLKSEIGPGRVIIRYTGNLSRDAQLLEDSFFLGCQMIADTYPQHVHIAQACTALNCKDKKQAEVLKIRRENT